MDSQKLVLVLFVVTVGLPLLVGAIRLLLLAPPASTREVVNGGE